MSIIDDARMWVRTTSMATDPEIVDNVAAALSDMRRVGVRESLLDPVAPDPLAKIAVNMYVKANYGYDNPEAERFMASYRQTVADLLNSDANEMAGGDMRRGDFSASVSAALGAMLT